MKGSKLSAQAKIPHILHQVFYDGVQGNRLPPALQEHVDCLLAANPGWEHRLYDDKAMERFIADSYGADILVQFQSIDPRYAAARVDLFRYLLMYRTGGIYLDIKSTAEDSLDSIASRCFPFALSHWDDGPEGRHGGWGIYPELAEFGHREFQQWHIISAAEHPYLLAVIETVLKNIKSYKPWKLGIGRRGVFRLTGPIAYSLAIYPIVDSFPHQKFSDEREIGLTYNVLGEGNHRGLFRTHYAFNAVPLVMRNGIERATDWAYTAPVRAFYALLAIKAKFGVFVRARPRLEYICRKSGMIK